MAPACEVYTGQVFIANVECSPGKKRFQLSMHLLADTKWLKPTMVH